MEDFTLNKNIEYMKLFMEYETDDMPIIYFYEVDLDNERLCLREIEIFSNRQVKTTDDLYRDVIEAVPIPTKDEFDSKVWGEGFHAIVITKEEFERIWASNIFTEQL